LMLLTGFLFLIGILAVQLVHPINIRIASTGVYEGCDRCPRAFESTFSAVITFVQQIITGDSWGAVSIPIIEEEPWTGVFFGAVFVLIELMVLNVILSLVVESSLKASKEDTDRVLKEKARTYKETADSLKALCAEMDDDHSGHLTKEELMHGFQRHPKFQEMMMLMDFTFSDLDAVFGILDKDGSGELAYDEFAEELYKMKTHDSHTLLVFIKFYVSEIKAMMGKVLDMEFTQLHQALGVVDSSQRLCKLKAGGREALPASPSIVRKPDSEPESVYHAIRDLQRSLDSDVARFMQELVHKVDSQSRALAELQRADDRPHIGGGELVGLSAARAPQHVPQPAHEERDAFDCNVSARRNEPGPICCSVGRGLGEAIGGREAQRSLLLLGEVPCPSKPREARHAFARSTA